MVNYLRIEKRLANEFHDTQRTIDLEPEHR